VRVVRNLAKDSSRVGEDAVTRVEFVCTGCGSALAMDFDAAVFRDNRSMQIISGRIRLSHSCGVPIQVSIGPQPAGYDDPYQSSRAALGSKEGGR